jgi:threonylcarbamoyladenosine tRNA methylthiotransferase MtaB
MARRYTRAGVIRAVELLRGACENPFIAADIITGFPGETAADHAQTESLIRETELASLHVFPFSRRPGTPAWDMPNRVPERVTRERASSLRALAASGRERFANSLIGCRLHVIIEKANADSWEGLCENYMTVRGTPDPAAVPGALIPVRITAAADSFLTGEIICQAPSDILDTRGIT